jgi:uncharacterized membrane protein HdeD (DUF308 family)
MSDQDVHPRSQLELLGGSWKLLLGVGLLTALLGLIIAIDPGSSLVFIAILAGIELIVSGVYRIVRSFSEEAAHGRTVSVVMGLVLLLGGLFLVRHLDVTLLLLAALVGLFWIVTGVAEIAAGAALSHGTARTWLLISGVVGVIAGVFVLVYPVGSLLAVTLLIGLWLIVRGATQVSTAMMARRTPHQ